MVRLNYGIHQDRNPFELRREFARFGNVQRRFPCELRVRDPAAAAGLLAGRVLWTGLTCIRFWKSHQGGSGKLEARLTGSAPSSWVPAAAAIRSRDDLQKVAFGVLEVDTTSPVVAIDFVGLGLPGISLVGELPVTDLMQDFIEL